MLLAEDELDDLNLSEGILQLNLGCELEFSIYFECFLCFLLLSTVSWLEKRVLMKYILKFCIFQMLNVTRYWKHEAVKTAVDWTQAVRLQYPFNYWRWSLKLPP